MSIVSLPQHLASLRGRNEGPSAARRQQLEAVCEQFEAMFLQQILKQMRKAGDVLAAGNPLRSRELDTMRDLYDEALALAAYNAGPGKVDEWLVQIGDPRNGAIGTAAWVERIPYAETRNYTRNILRDLQALPASQAQQGGETLKRAGEPVALHRQRAVGGHLSVAFAQPIRIESKEPQS